MRMTKIWIEQAVKKGETGVAVRVWRRCEARGDGWRWMQRLVGGHVAERP